MLVKIITCQWWCTIKFFLPTQLVDLGCRGIHWSLPQMHFRIVINPLWVKSYMHTTVSCRQVVPTNSSTHYSNSKPHTHTLWGFRLLANDHIWEMITFRKWSHLGNPICILTPKLLGNDHDTSLGMVSYHLSFWDNTKVNRSPYT